MKYVIHGEDLVSSRNYLRSLKKQYQSVVSLDGERLSWHQLDHLVSTRPLFSGKLLVVVENYSNPEKILTADPSTDIVFWWSKTQRKIPVADRVLLFRDKSGYGIFRFADSVGQKQAKKALILLNELLEKNIPPERIIATLTRQFKLIAQILDGKIEGISSSEFVRNKFLAQSRLWSFKEIQESFVLLFQIDLKIKTGKTKPKTALTFLTHRLCNY